MEPNDVIWAAIAALSIMWVILFLLVLYMVGMQQQFRLWIMRRMAETELNVVFICNVLGKEPPHSMQRKP